MGTQSRKGFQFAKTIVAEVGWNVPDFHTVGEQRDQQASHGPGPGLCSEHVCSWTLLFSCFTLDLAELWVCPACGALVTFPASAILCPQCRHLTFGSVGLEETVLAASVSCAQSLSVLVPCWYVVEDGSVRCSHVEKCGFGIYP